MRALFRGRRRVRADAARNLDRARAALGDAHHAQARVISAVEDRDWERVWHTIGNRCASVGACGCARRPLHRRTIRTPWWCGSTRDLRSAPALIRPRHCACRYWTRCPVAGRTVIDYGCGSGILGIAALKLGAAHVIAVDIDPQALLATRDNAERNGVSTNIEVHGVTRTPAARACSPPTV